MHDERGDLEEDAACRLIWATAVEVADTVVAVSVVAVAVGVVSATRRAYSNEQRLSIAFGYTYSRGRRGRSNRLRGRCTRRSKPSCV